MWKVRLGDIGLELEPGFWVLEKWFRVGFSAFAVHLTFLELLLLVLS